MPKGHPAAKLQLIVKIDNKVSHIYCQSLNAAAHENTLMVLPQIYYLRCSELLEVAINPTKKPNSKLKKVIK